MAVMSQWREKWKWLYVRSFICQDWKWSPSLLPASHCSTRVHGSIQLWGKLGNVVYVLTMRRRMDIIIFYFQLFLFYYHFFWRLFLKNVSVVLFGITLTVFLFSKKKGGRLCFLFVFCFEKNGVKMFDFFFNLETCLFIHFEIHSLFVIFHMICSIDEQKTIK